MLALAVSFMIAVYLLGPDLISRWVLGFVVPRKNLVQSKGEEITRAILWAAIPLAIAIAWAAGSGSLQRSGTLCDIKMVFSAMYSDAYFKEHQEAFFTSLSSVFWFNVCLLSRLYILVVVFSVGINFVIMYYGRIRRWITNAKIKALLATLILPRVSEWHVLLSKMLLPSSDLQLNADVLTKGNVLYQGVIEDKMLGADGSLQSITLGSPRRFLREQFLKKKDESPETRSEDYWHTIPGNLFVVMGSEITNLNLRYIRPDILAYEPSDEEREILRRLLQRLTEPTRQ